jgi:hypothetical protein
MTRERGRQQEHVKRRIKEERKELRQQKQPIQVSDIKEIESFVEEMYQSLRDKGIPRSKEWIRENLPPDEREYLEEIQIFQEKEKEDSIENRKAKEERITNLALLYLYFRKNKKVELTQLESGVNRMLKGELDENIWMDVLNMLL